MVGCAVSGCRSSNDKRLKRNMNRTLREVKFFRFPRDDTYKNIWLTNCARKDNKANVKNLYICSKHFKPEDYARNLMHELLNYEPINSKKLKKDAIPALNMPLPLTAKNEIFLVDNKYVHVADRQIIINLARKLKQCKGQPNRAHRKPFFTDGEGSTQNTMQTTVIDEMGSKDIIVRPPNTVFFEKTFRESDNISKITKSLEMEQEASAKWHQMQLKFLDHVLLIWINRTRCNDPKILGCEISIKAKAKETADILGTYILTPNKWLQAFKTKMFYFCQSRKDKKMLAKKSQNIVDIIMEERPHFFYDEENLPDTKDSKESTREERDFEEVASEENELIEGSIETYDDALDCLRMVEDYALCVRNLKAVILISEMEKILRNRKH